MRESILHFVSQFWKDLTPFNLLSFILGLIGLFLTILYFYRSRKTKIPLHAIWSNNILPTYLNKEIFDIDIFFKNERIDILTITKIAVWNGGNETIHDADLPSIKKFSLIPKNGIKIYDIEIIENTDLANNFRINCVDNVYEFLFEYLDPKEIILIQVAHSGNSSRDIKLEGKLKGSILWGMLQPLDYYPTDSKHFKVYKYSLFVFFIIGFILMFPGIIGMDDKPNGIKLILEGIQLLFIFLLVKNQIPKKIIAFFNNDKYPRNRTS